ncbi:MAG: hypothetical protein U1U88_001575 [Lawsonella clevelandensis]
MGKHLTPVQRVGEWPDVVVQVGVAATLPQRYPVPLVLAPVDWSDPDAAAHTLAAAVRTGTRHRALCAVGDECGQPAVVSARKPSN